MDNNSKDNNNKHDDIKRNGERDEEVNPEGTILSKPPLISVGAEESVRTGDQDTVSYSSGGIKSGLQVTNPSNGRTSAVSNRTAVHHLGGSRDFGPSHRMLSRNATRASTDNKSKFAFSRMGRSSVKPDAVASRMGALSKTSSYYHGDIVDENLLLSAARIDSTLLRLFARSRDGDGTKKVLETEDQLLPFLNYSDSDLISIDAVLWSVHPMESAHKETLEQEMAYLEENVKPVEILRRLYMDEVLTHMDYNTITR